MTLSFLFVKQRIYCDVLAAFWTIVLGFADPWGELCRHIPYKACSRGAITDSSWEGDCHQQQESRLCPKPVCSSQQDLFSQCHFWLHRWAPMGMALVDQTIGPPSHYPSIPSVRGNPSHNAPGLFCNSISVHGWEGMIIHSWQLMKTYIPGNVATVTTSYSYTGLFF